MKKLWLRGLAWMDALKFRERILVFVAVLAVLAAVTDIFFISSLTAEQKKLTNKLDSQSAANEARQDRIQLDMLQRANARASVVNSDIARVQAELDAVERDITALALPTGDASGLAAVLSRVLKRNDRVKLVRVVSVGADTVTAAPVAGGGIVAAVTGAAQAIAQPATGPGPLSAPQLTPQTPASPTGPTTLQRNALDVTLSGNYLDLLAYVSTLEKAMPGLRWGALSFSTETAPAQIKLRIILIAAAP
jgi:MSHA biogenesis protein MshJ